MITPIGAVIAEVKSGWTACPVLFGNGGAHVPADAAAIDYAPADDPAAAWAMIETTVIGVDDSCLGTVRAKSERGQIWLHVFTPVGTGPVAADALVRSFIELLECRRFGGLVTGAGIPGDGEAGDDDGLWWRLSATVPYLLQQKV